MSLLADAVEQAPRVDFRPPSTWSDASLVAQLSSGYGLTPDPWQLTVLEGWTGRRADGKWAALTCGLSIPRQNGKNGVIEMRVLYGMVMLGEKFLHTAHEVKTARKAFVRLKSFFENERVYPELADLVRTIRSTNGQEAIELTNGGSCEFIARSKSSGRGYTVDALIADEAQEMTDDALEALIPTTSAAPLANPQWIFTGTPPGPQASGQVFSKVRRDALNHSDRRLSWQEWSAESIEAIHDRTVWHAVNPALGSRLQMDVVEGERSRFTDEGFARERLGVWLDGSASSAITEAEWAAVCDPDTKRQGGQVVFALEAEVDRSEAAITVIAPNASERLHLELIDPGKKLSIPEAGERLVELAKRHKPRAVVISSTSPAASLVPMLKAARVHVLVIGPQQCRAAAGGFQDAVRGKTLAHSGRQFTLTKSVLAARRHVTGSGWLWREDPGSAPLRSASLAHYGWLVKKPAPSTGTTRRAVLI